MDEKQTLYRMNRLLRIAEIEAYSARTNVGSRAEYFALLTTFIEAAPSRVEELIAALKVHNAELFQRNGYELRKMLLAIGANGLLWETERQSCPEADCGRNARSGRFFLLPASNGWLSSLWIRVLGRARRWRRRTMAKRPLPSQGVTHACPGCPGRRLSRNVSRTFDRS